MQFYSFTRKTMAVIETKGVKFYIAQNIGRQVSHSSG